MKSHRYAAGTAVVAALALGAASVQAQSVESTPTNGFGTTAGVSAGMAAGLPGGGPALSARFETPVTRQLGVELAGGFLMRGSGARAWNATGSLVIGLTDPTRRSVPFVTIGGGVYGAWFDLGNPRFFGGAMRQVAPGAGLMWSGSGHQFMMQGMSGYGPAFAFNVNDMPQFYARRLGTMTVPADGRWGTRNFIDPAVVLGGGLRVQVTPHMTVRPDVRAIVVVSGGHSYTTTIVGVDLRYRF